MKRTSQREKRAWASCSSVQDSGKGFVRNYTKRLEGDGRVQLMTFNFVIILPRLWSTGAYCCIFKVRHWTTVDGVQLLYMVISIELTCPPCLCSSFTFESCVSNSYCQNLHCMYNHSHRWYNWCAEDVIYCFWLSVSSNTGQEEHKKRWKWMLRLNT